MIPIVARRAVGGVVAVVGASLVAGVVLTSAISLAATPIPPYPPDGVAVAGVPDHYDEVRRYLGSFRSRVDAQYRVAVVDLSDPEDRRGPEYGDETGGYIDAVIEAWRPELDMASHVTIVLALSNREVLVQPGSRWVELGYGGREVGRITDASPFPRFARAGDYGQAIIELVRYIDDDLAARLQQRERRGAEAAQQVANLTTEIATEARQIGDAEVEAAEAQQLLERARAALGEASEALERGDLGRSLVAGREGIEAVAAAENALLKARRDHQFRTRILPIVLGVVVFSVAMFLFLVVRSRRRVFKLRAENEIRAWEDRLDRAGRRLLALETEHGLILGYDDLATRFSGATAGPVTAAARLVDDLFLGYEAAQRLLAEAKAMVAGVGPLSSAGYLEAARHLDAGEVVIRTGELTERRLFLPEAREIRLEARQLLVEMDADYRALSDTLGDLEQRFQSAWELASRSVESLTTAEGVLDDLEATSLDLKVYRARLDALAERVAQLRAESQRDPFGTADALAELGREGAELERQLEEVSSAITRLSDEIRPERAAAEARVSKLRDSEGMRLVEPGFEPDITLEYVDECALGAQLAIEQGDPLEGGGLVEDAAEALAELDELIDTSVRSRAESRDAVNALVASCRALREQVPAARAALSALRAKHADEALQPALDNAEEADAALDHATSCLREATTAVTVSEQRYLAAAELVRRAEQIVSDVRALFAEIEAKEAELAARRQSAVGHLAALDARAETLTVDFTGPAPWVGEDSLALFEAVRERLSELHEQASAERPNWLGLAAESEAQVRVAERLVTRVSGEKQAYEHFQAQRSAIEAKLGGVSRLLDRSADDREAANEALEQARSELERAFEIAQTERPFWPRALARLLAGDERLTEAQRLAEADFTQAADARAAIGRAEEAERTADRRYGHGVRVDLGATRDALRAARALLLEHDYSRAGARASNAAYQARMAQTRATERAAAKAVAVSRRSASSSWSAASSSRSSWSASRSWSSRRPSASSRSGWSSRRASGRSSFKSSFGSSAGRSSFGRSSSRSKIGRSSGRSKW